LEEQGQLCVSVNPVHFAGYVLTSCTRLRLATHLYAEHLLDREHYMEWLVSGLENCPQPKLPMWLLITQIYWKDLVKFRRYGRRLVTALLDQHTTVRFFLSHSCLVVMANNPERRFTTTQTMTSLLPSYQEYSYCSSH
jgi:hypothetical protein